VAGILYIVATPIGNLGDITPRVQKVLTEVDFILAEDTRVSIKLLNHLGIKKRMISCHNFNEKSRLEVISQCSRDNQAAALISDAGTPLVSDPGNEIVGQAIELGMKIIPIPGPSAFLLALVVSGLSCERFVFEGFLPSKPTLQKERLEELSNERRTMVFYEAPHRLLKTLLSIEGAFGDRKICLARELTKLHEEIIRGNLAEIITDIKNRSSKILGEYVLVVEGNKNDDLLSITSEDLSGKIRQMLSSGKSVKTIVQEITAIYKLKRSEIYELSLKIQAQQNIDNE
jgi:16S rRNA (cytidine1402-2'-O)-methyltransferase